MSERDRLPRRLIDDRRAYPEVRVVEDPRGYPEARMVDDRRGYSDIRMIEDRRGHSDIRLVEDLRGHPDMRLVEDRRGHPDMRLVEDRRGHPDMHLVEDRRGHPDMRLVQDRRGHPDMRLVEDRRGNPGIRVVDDHRGYPGIRVVESRRGHPGIRESPHMRGLHPRPAVLEEELELQEAELRRLLADNRALVEEHAVLNRELQTGKDEVRHLNVIIADINTEKEAYINKLVDKRRKLEAELRANEPLREEIVQLRGEIEKLIDSRKELSAEVTSLMDELSAENSSKQQVPLLKAELDGLQQELIHVRTACGLEKKGNIELVEQRKAMEKNMISMTQEIEQMRVELAEFETRSWGTGGVGTYGMQMGSPKVTFATPYGDSYNIRAEVSEKGHLLPPESSSWGTYDKNRLQYR